MLKAGYLEKAIVKFEECLAIDELNARYNSTILLNIAIILFKVKDYYLAISALNKALKYNPKYVEALVKRGEIYLMLNEYNEAIRDFAEAQ